MMLTKKELDCLNPGDIINLFVHPLDDRRVLFENYLFLSYSIQKNIITCLKKEEVVKLPLDIFIKIKKLN